MLKYWVWLTCKKELSYRKMQQVLNFFGTPQLAFYAERQDYLKIDALSQTEIAALEDRTMDPANQVLETCYNCGISILTINDAAYPAKLREIPEPPLLLYYKGKFPAMDSLASIGVVGTRNATDYGLVQAKRFGYQLGKGGAVVVSGAASGIDAMGMKGALSADAPVVGVLGCGVDVIYPKSNRELFEDLIWYGCLISEYPPGTPAMREHFPRRNRIISGLSDGVVVIEAPARSGALITANDALEQDRDVFAVPGCIGNLNSVGCNRLIRNGAVLVESGWDILEEYTSRYPQMLKEFHGGTKMTLHPQETALAEKNQSMPDKKAKIDKNNVDNAESKAYIDVQEVLELVPKQEATILEQLSQGVQNVDALSDLCQLPAGDVLAALTMLEIQGYVMRLPGNRISLAYQKKI